MIAIHRALIVLALVFFASGSVGAGELRGTGDLGLVIERASGAVQVIETTGRTSLGRIDGHDRAAEHRIDAARLNRRKNRLVVCASRSNFENF